MLKQNEIYNAIKDMNDGKIIILPTDTIYGLSAIYNKENEKKINLLKGSERDKPLIILVASIEQAMEFGELDNKILKILISKEPTTIIFGTENQSYAIRMIMRDDLKEIVLKTGPIISTSVNQHGQEPLRNKKDLEAFNTKIRVYFDVVLNGEPSRIYNLITKEWIR